MMSTRIDDMLVYSTQADHLDASLYNLWRRARLHLGSPLRLSLPGLKQLVLILEDDSWVVVDEVQYDMPVLAWVEFQDSGRNNLHMPILCTLNFYHYLASRLRDKVLARMEEALEQRLSDAPSKNPTDIGGR